MNVCVFCSSCDAVADEYKDDAMQLGKWLAEQGHTLVYGGATGGLMDAVAKGASAADGEIVGIIPDSIVERGRQSKYPTQLFQVGDMSERKAMLKEYADLFVVLPGGIGTLDEMTDVLTSCIVGEMQKSTIIYNPNGYWAGWLMQVERLKAEHTLKDLTACDIRIAETNEQLIKILQTLAAE